MTHASMPSLDDGYTQPSHYASVLSSATTLPMHSGGVPNSTMQRQVMVMTGHLADIAQSLRQLVSACGGSRHGVAKALEVLRSNLADSDASESDKAEDEEDEADEGEQDDPKDDEDDAKSQASSRDERARKRGRSRSPASATGEEDIDEEMEDAAAPASSLHTAVSLPTDIPSATKTARKQAAPSGSKSLGVSKKRNRNR